MVTVGDHIKKRRLELGLFQAQAGKLLGVCEATVKNWEKGHKGIPMRSYPAVLAFLGYDPHPEPKTLSDQLQAIRRRNGWRLETAAKSIGVDEDTWRLWEAGRAPHRMHDRPIRELLEREPKS